MRVYAVSPMFPVKVGRDGKPVVIEVNSMTSSKVYRVDVTYGRCSCLAWIYQKGGGRKPCKHLRALGFVECMDTTMQPQLSEQVVEVKESKMRKMQRQVESAKQAVMEYEM